MTDTLKALLTQQFAVLVERVRVANKPGDLDGLLACHILEDEPVKNLEWHVSCALGDWLAESGSQIKQGNFPVLAAIGYSMSVEQEAKTRKELADSFVAGFRRLQQRELFPADGISFPFSPKAFLGIALGVKHIPEDSAKVSAVEWLKDVLAKTLKRARTLPMSYWYLYTSYVLNETPETVHDISKSTGLAESSFLIWAVQKRTVSLGKPESQLPQLQERILDLMLKNSMETMGAPEAALVFSAGSTCVKKSVHEIILASSHVVTILSRFEDAMKRWPERWTIKDEGDVQSIVWLMLRSCFEELVDEDTLPKFGHSSYKADFGIPSLGLLIEVKMVRKAQDFKKVEKEIMEDSVGYLQKTKRYSKLVVFIYDESSSVQEHGTTRHELRRIQTIEDVVIVSRPSQLKLA
jgi:hypothetical protein